ncbi:sensor histidine kinase [Piscinibacter sakaiensis]|uniref:sensor histidine kinase n=1 Tax=Piscinibacter sakaiensis TaxID=1547922 RepID=UPI003AAA2352
MPDILPKRKREQQVSLFGEILDWMLAPLLLLWPMSVLLTWLVAQGIANKPFDRELGEAVALLARQIIADSAAAAAPAAPIGLPPGAAEILRGDGEQRLYFQVQAAGGRYLAGERSLQLPNDEQPPPPGELRFRDDTFRSEAVRVAYMWVDVPVANGRMLTLVQVAETLGRRSRLATEIIKGVIVPQFVILPIAVLLVWLALARGIAPLNDLQQRIRRRDSSDLSPIDEREAPEEVSPLVRAINDLLARLDQSIRSQKQFIADAAHQLKTPLAGLHTQAELAQRGLDAADPDIRQLRSSLRHISASSHRAAHMVNQLLAMARAENKKQHAGNEAIDLSQLARETVQHFVPQAMEKRIDLGYEGPQSRDTAALAVSGHRVLLRELIGNLVDNALAYTPPGGVVTVRITEDPFGQVVVLQVEDSGPGIAAADREQVFQPFFRALDTGVEGSGLGLAIVREIAEQHGVDVELEDANPRYRSGVTDQAGAAFGPGALFTLRFRTIANQAGG